LKAYQFLRGLVVPGGGAPVRRFASFNKGLIGGAGCGGVEHQELPGVDVLFSRGVPADPTRTDGDVDWERAR